LSSSGQIGHPAVNSYANIDGDSAGNVFSDLTDSSQAAYYWHSDANWTAEKAIIVAAVESGDDVNVESYGDTKNAAGKTTFVSGHAFAVVGYDATTGDFILRNPWGTYDSTVDYQFEASMSDVAGVSGDFVVSNSANDAVEIRAAAQDQMAVGTTSVANLLSVVDTTGAQITQIYVRDGRRWIDQSQRRDQPGDDGPNRARTGRGVRRRPF
jgi:hypothetical protein